MPYHHLALATHDMKATDTFYTAGLARTAGVMFREWTDEDPVSTLFVESGREDVVVFLRPGATSEGESFFPLERADIIKKTLPEIAEGSVGPLAAGELYLAVRLPKVQGGETNVPIRGVEPASLPNRSELFRWD